MVPLLKVSIPDEKKIILVIILFTSFYLESGNGKIDIIKAGAYDDVDVSLMVHPR